MTLIKKSGIALLYTMAMLISATHTFCQCPESGLKIQSKDCEAPKGLSVSGIGCAEMKVKWVGSKTQAYLVNASYSDGSSDKITAAKVSGMSNDNGNCTATIAVSEGATVNWSVQSICSVNGAKVYSVPVTGTETYIPMCRKVNAPATSKGFQAYPNPCKGSLIVEYTGKMEGAVSFNIFDVNGKKVFTQSQKSMQNVSNQYKLDLHDLPPGAYMLEAINGAETKQTRFVMMRE